MNTAVSKDGTVRAAAAAVPDAVHREISGQNHMIKATAIAPVLSESSGVEMKFATTLQGTTTTGIEVPPEVVEALGKGKKPAVVLTVNGYTYRSTVAVMGGRYLVPVSAAHRQAAGLTGGDEIEVEIAVDEKPREVVVPADFAAALAAEPKARDFFDGLSYSQRNWFVLGIEEAKKPETRASRIVKAVQRLASGRGQR